MKVPFRSAALLCLTCAGLHAQDAAPVNTAIILRDLDMMEQQQKQTLLSAKQAALARIKAASASGASASNFYLDAIEAVEFEGKPNKASLFTDWKAANGDFLRSREMQTMVQLHLQYLALSLERSGGKAELFVVPSLNYARQLADQEGTFNKLSERSEAKTNDKATERDKEVKAMNQGIKAARKDLLDKSMADGVFAKWMQLAPWLPKADSWELQPGNLSGILEKNVRTVLRQTKSPQLIETWDLEMKVLANRATSGQLDSLATDFNANVAPKMVFARANDLIIIGYKNRAINEIYGLVKTYPQHPDFSKWVTRLRELVTAPPAPAATEATPAPSAPAETTP